MADQGRKPRIKFFTGAPQASSLDWSEQCLYPADCFTVPVKRFIHGLETDEVRPPTATSNWPSWRSIPINGAELASLEDERGQLASNRRQRFQIASTGESSKDEEVEHDFLEHSIVAYDTQMPEQVERSMSLQSFDDTFLTESMGESFSKIPPLQTINFPHTVTDLKKLHSAAELVRLSPATVTVDLIVGITSVTPAKTVKLKWGSTMDIIELAVGDETRTGFCVNLWFQSASNHIPKMAPSTNNSLRKTIERLPSGQIVLLKNVALNQYQGRVYGQSLKPVNRIMTTVTCLSILDANSYPPWAKNKIERVDEWARNFLGPTRRSIKGRGGMDIMNVLENQALPPDTQVA